MDKRLEELGVAAGNSARSNLCDDCVDKLNKQLSKFDLLRGPRHIQGKIEKICCDKCKRVIRDAGREACRSVK